jgi:predicted lipoprotein with Yx(FWY)xxD motif
MTKVLSIDVRARWFVATFLAAAVAAAGFLIASPAHSATNSSATVSLHRTSLGMVLVTSKGRTLYLFMKDRNGKSACYSACAKFWPPLLASAKPTAGAGVKASLLGRTRRSNGTMQVTYNRHPLYRFSLDKATGQTKGEGLLEFGAKWYVVSSHGGAMIKSSSTTTSGTTTTNTSTYSYPAPPAP